MADMDPVLLLKFALTALQELPALIRSGKDAIGLIRETEDALKRMIAENRNPTPEEWSSLNKRIADLRGELHS